MTFTLLTKCRLPSSHFQMSANPPLNNCLYVHLLLYLKCISLPVSHHCFQESQWKEEINISIIVSFFVCFSQFFIVSICE